MKLYPIPGGTWAGTETDWKREMKARGLNPKDFEATKAREIPTNPKPAFIEWLNFNAVDVYRLPEGTTVSREPIDIDALRAQHNAEAPQPEISATEMAVATQVALVTAHTLEEQFENLPLQDQLRLSMFAINRAKAALLTA